MTLTVFLRRGAAALAALTGAIPVTLGVVPSGIATAPQAVAATLPGANPAAILARLTEAQRVGQLIMVSASVDGPSRATKAAIRTDHAGSVYLAGRSNAGVSATRTLTDNLQSLATQKATGGVPLLVSTDQEGGEVQVLTGPGFSTIPTAVKQGKLSPTRLLTRSERWGSQLSAAGVTLNLAPVLDTVPPDRTKTNQPIGRYDREYGTDPQTVRTAGLAFVRGMHQAGVETAVKHFPGLGRASGNTDTTTGVHDDITTRHDAYIAPYAAATRVADAGVVMVSSATYTKIDPQHRALFSPTLLQGMLRSDLGFTGVIMSDSMDAVALQDLTPAQRAVRFLLAGGDLVLTTNPHDVPAMTQALLDRANAHAAFRRRVDESCLRILIAKQRAGLLPGAVAAAQTSKHLYVAERTGTDITVRVRSGSTWSAAVSLGADTTRAPALAPLPRAEGVEVAQVNAAGHVAVRQYIAGTTSPWRHLGLDTTSAPAVATSSSGRIAVAVRAGDLGVRVRELRPKSGWGDWIDLGGSFAAAAPAIAYTGMHDIEVFAVDRTQSVLRDVRHNGTWSGWTSVGGTADSAPAETVDTTSGATTLFVRGRNSSLRTRVVGSTSWRRVRHVYPAAAPAAAVKGPTQTVVVEGVDGRLHLARHTSSGWSRWSLLPFD